MSAGLMVVLAVALIGGMPHVRNLLRSWPANRTTRDPIGDAARRPGDVWWLQPCRPECPAARALAGRRLPTERTVRLPLQGHRADGCRCCYRPLAEQRRGQRRSGAVRREIIRVDATADRRRFDRRRPALSLDGLTLHAAPRWP